MNQNVSNKIKTFNYIFTLFILIYHLRFLDGYNIIYRNNFDKSILDFFMSITTHFDDLALTAFFIISSFLFYYNIDSSNQAIIKIKKRLKTLFIPYCIWTIIVIIFHSIVFRSLPFNSIQTFIKIIFFYPIDGPLWYILALLIFILPAPLIIKLKNKKILSTVCFVLSLVLLYFYKMPNLIGSIWWWYPSIIHFLPAYLTGVWLALNFSKNISTEKYNQKLFIMITFLMLVVTLCFKNYAGFTFLEPYVYIIAILFVWLLFSSKIFTKNPLLFQSSFFIYVTHQPILILIFNKITKLIIKDMPIFGYQMVIIKLFQTFLIVMFSYFVISLAKKYLPSKMNNLIFGGRI